MKLQQKEFNIEITKSTVVLITQVLIDLGYNLDEVSESCLQGQITCHSYLSVQAGYPNDLVRSNDTYSARRTFSDLHTLLAYLYGNEDTKEQKELAKLQAKIKELSAQSDRLKEAMES